MALVALLFAHHGAGPEGEPPAALAVAGVTVIERQIALARSCGAARVLVVVERMPPGLVAALARGDVEVVRTTTGFRLADDDLVLILADSLLVGRQAIEAVLAGEPPRLAVWKGRAVHDGAERIDPATHWGGIALYSARMVAETLKDLGEWDLQATLLRAAYGDGRPAKVDLAALAAEDGPIPWQPIRGPDEADAATRSQLSARRSEIRDWPSQFIYPPAEKAMISVAISRGIEPALLGAVVAALGIFATAAFARGWLWAGLILALLSLPLLSATRRTMILRRDHKSSSQDSEITLQLLWFSGLSAFFLRTHEPAAPIAVAAIFGVSAWGNAYIRTAYRRVTTHSLDDAGQAETMLRRFGGQDSALLWSLLAFAIFNAWWWGYVWMAGYATATFVFTLVRAAKRLTEFGVPANRSSPRQRLDREPGLTLSPPSDAVDPA